MLLFGRDDYFERGIERASRVASVRLEPVDVAGVLVGMPAAPLPEGDYIVVLKESTGSVLSVSGVCLREATERWPRRFQAMLDDQARFAVGKPAAERPRREGEPLFSITTAIYDVDPPFLVALADSILGQRYDDFEWVLLDNGSRRPDTQQVSRDLAARDPRVRFWRVEDNRHIIGGNRFLLEHARGTYVIPVDHDDVLYPDALRILSIFVAEHHEPDLLYSDEQKITLSGVASEILWRPAWSNLAALSTCPASHLMVFKRTLALEAEFYSGDYARGSPDWDSALRLATRTSHIVHVPFVLYGWRMHPGSTALNEDSKNYLAESQKSVVRHALERLDLADRFEVAAAIDVLGYYHAVRRKQDGPRVLLHAVIPLDAPRDALTQLRSSLAHTRYEAISQRIYVPGQDDVGVGLAAAAGKIGIGGVKPEVVTYRDEADLLSLMFTGEAIESGEVHVVLNPMLASRTRIGSGKPLARSSWTRRPVLLAAASWIPTGASATSATCPVSMAFSPRPVMARTCSSSMAHGLHPPQRDRGVRLVHGGQAGCAPHDRRPQGHRSLGRALWDRVLPAGRASRHQDRVLASDEGHLRRAARASGGRRSRARRPDCRGVSSGRRARSLLLSSLHSTRRRLRVAHRRVTLP